MHEFPRVIGRYGDGDGPLLVVVVGLHGNEPMGCFAAQRVLKWLQETRQPLVGELLVMAGNCEALRCNQRYIDIDMNRAWSDAQVAALRAGEADLSVSEAREQLEILALLDEALAFSAGTATFLDLHTSSSPSAPFAIVGESDLNFAFAQMLSIPAPLVYGLDGMFDGPLLKYLGRCGHRTLAFEGGQHDDEQSILLHEAMIYMLLAACGHVGREQLPDLDERLLALREAAGDIPGHLEVFYRHAITPDDEFVMVPGFCNFAPVDEGQKLADDRRGALVAPEACRVLLPLYQAQGSDGYFLVRTLGEATATARATSL